MRNKKQLLAHCLAPLAGLGLAMLLAGCAAESDEAEAPGTCKIDCTSGKIGSKDMRIRFLHEKGRSLTCPKDTENYPLSVPLRFVVERPRRVLDAEYPPGVGQAPPVSVTNSEWEPVSGLAFHPLLLEGDGAKKNSDLEEDLFKGVETPPDNWCTDSCGVGAIEVVPKCPGNGTQGNRFKIGVFSGSLQEEYLICIDSTSC